MILTDNSKLGDSQGRRDFSVEVLGSPVRSKRYRDRPVVYRSPSETIMRNAILQLIKEARFNHKRALGTGSQVSILHAKSKMDIAAFMARNYRHAYSKRPL